MSLGLLGPCYCSCPWRRRPGHQNGRCFHRIQDLSHRLHLCWGRRRGRGSWDHVHSAISRVAGFAGNAAVGGDGWVGWSCGCLCSWRDGVTGPTAAAAQISVATSIAMARRSESCVPSPLLLLGSLGLPAQLLQLGDEYCRHCLHCFPCSASSVCYSSPTFRCTGLWNSSVSWCVGQRYLC